MNQRKRIVFIIVILALLGLALTVGTNLYKISAPATPTVGVSCPTPDETDIPICAPAGETTATPGLLPSAEAPGLLGTPVGP